VLICVVIAGGAAFGTAAQILLESIGFGFDSIRNDALAHRAATPHFALAWWAWWLSALGAFLVGPLCAAATRAIVAGCRLMPALHWSSWRSRCLRLPPWLSCDHSHRRAPSRRIRLSVFW